MTLKVNGRMRSVDVDPATPLLYVLSDDLELQRAEVRLRPGPVRRLHGDRERAARSARASRRSSPCRASEITTLEGIGTIEKPHPLQKAFIEEQAAQCGFCVNGVIMTAKAFLDTNPKASEEEIQQAMSACFAAASRTCACCAAIENAQTGDGAMSVSPKMNLRRDAVPVTASKDKQSAAARGTVMTREARAALRDAGFSRRRFLQGAGALIVSFSMRGVLVQCRSAPRSSRVAMSGRASHDQLDSWIAIGADGGVTAYTGKEETRPGHLHGANSVGGRRALRAVRAREADLLRYGDDAGSGRDLRQPVASHQFQSRQSGAGGGHGAPGARCRWHRSD